MSLKPGASDDRRDNDINVCLFHNPSHGFRADKDFDPRRQSGPIFPACSLGIRYRNTVRAKVLGLLPQKPRIRMSRQGYGTQSTLGSGDHFQRAAANAPRGAQHDDVNRTGAHVVQEKWCRR